MNENKFEKYRATDVVNDYFESKIIIQNTNHVTA